MLASNLLASLAIALSPVAQDAPLPVVDVKLHAYGVEIISASSSECEALTLVTDPVEFAYADGMTLLDCANVATTTCGTAGVAWVRFRINSQTGEESCEFGCNTTGTGG